MGNHGGFLKFVTCKGTYIWNKETSFLWLGLSTRRNHTGLKKNWFMISLKISYCNDTGFCIFIGWQKLGHYIFLIIFCTMCNSGEQDWMPRLWISDRLGVLPTEWIMNSKSCQSNNRNIPSLKNYKSKWWNWRIILFVLDYNLTVWKNAYKKTYTDSSDSFMGEHPFLNEQRVQEMRPYSLGKN